MHNICYHGALNLIERNFESDKKFILSRITIDKASFLGSAQYRHQNETIDLIFKYLLKDDDLRYKFLSMYESSPLELICNKSLLTPSIIESLLVDNENGKK